MLGVSKLRLTIAATVVCTFGFAAVPAQADNIVVNTWYAGFFDGTIPSPVSGAAGAFGTDGPVLGGGFASALAAPAGTTWTITLTSPGTLTVTDLQTAGDFFTVFDDGSQMLAATSPFTAAGQNPGQVSPGAGLTSFPCSRCFDTSAGADINEALGNANYSSATFFLLAGINNITIQYNGVIGGGFVDFIAEGASAVPLPPALPLFATGLVGLGLLGWRSKKKIGI